MIQALFHLWGDYVFQNHWMAVNKVKTTTEGWIACAIHCFLYTLPFCFIAPDYLAIVVIYCTHFLIDHCRLAKYIIRLRDWNFTDKPLQEPFISFWLFTICDNTLHVTINYLSLKYL